MIPRLLVPLLFLLAPLQACADDFPGLSGFIDEMVQKHGFERAELERTFQQVEHQDAVIEAISRPVVAPKPWAEYRGSFMTQKQINNGLAFWKTWPASLQRAEQKYGVPQEIIVALIGVETRYGANTGKHNTLSALTTLAFDYPRRADFFRSELEQYLLLARERGMDMAETRGSYAGALGIPQFMPSSYRKYAVDWDGDDRADLLNNPIDAIGSVANYLQQHGWRAGQPVALQVTNAADLDPSMRSLSAWEEAGVILPAKPMLAPSQTVTGTDGRAYSKFSGFSGEDVSGGALWWWYGNYGTVMARLLNFTMLDGRKEYWLVFDNFDVIMKYNNSHYYAMTVFQLAQALKRARASSVP
ncbi:MAG: lytic murein transglycosylase B [Gallionellaceae bacterium]|jgi:membrane-bound lytic murein transglycosylase B|nr:lytic murein transglycosylase B [Gallionellaceae bacterium]